MAVVEGGRPAITHYRVHQRYRAHTALECRLETGRTHQIRVHMAHIRHPLVGDPLYGGALRIPKAASAELTAALRGFRSEEHTSELQSLMRNSYAVFCLKKKTNRTSTHDPQIQQDQDLE